MGGRLELARSAGRGRRGRPHRPNAAQNTGATALAPPAPHCPGALLLRSSLEFSALTKQRCCTVHAQLAAGAEHSVALDNSGALLVWGSGRRGQLGNGAAAAGALDARTHSLLPRPLLALHGSVCSACMRMLCICVCMYVFYVLEAVSVYV